jgi:hypothetical protein
VFTNRYTQLFKIPIAGGVEELVPIPNVADAVEGPGGRIAYNPIAGRYQQWKEYRGGTVSRIWIYDPAGRELEKVPQPPTRSNDADPMWLGGTVYFRSDRSGEFNIFSYEPRTKSVKQVTTYSDFPILSASAGGGKVVFEQAGYLHLFDPSTSKTTRLKIGVTADLPETRPRFATGARWIRNATLSPTGVRAAFEYRGEIVTVPAEKGDPAQPDDDAELARAVAGVVAGWHTGRVLLGRRRRVCPAHRRPGRQGAGPYDQGDGQRLLRRSHLVARRQEGLVRRQLTEPLLAGPRVGRRDAHRRSSRLHAGRFAGARLVTRFEVDCLRRQPAAARDGCSSVLAGRAQVDPDHRRTWRRRRPGLRPQWKVPVFLRIHGCGACGGLVRAVEPGHAVLAQRVPRGVAQRSVVATRARE